MASASVVSDILILLQKKRNEGLTRIPLSDQSIAFLESVTTDSQAQSSEVINSLPISPTPSSVDSSPASAEPELKTQTEEAIVVQTEEAIVVPTEVAPQLEQPQTPIIQKLTDDVVQISGKLSNLDVLSDELNNTISSCRACTLCQSRQHAISGQGDENARIMIVGDFPGAVDDEDGILFSDRGEAGQMLHRMIQAMKLKPDDLFMTSIVKCRPPNRSPQEKEVDLCIGYLKRQIELVKPDVMILFGALPVTHLLGLKGRQNVRGQWMTYNGIPVMPTYHPNYLLRKPEMKRAVWTDLQGVITYLESKS
ncbi:uracil-DNA glycosylase [bacterium AH-315-E10]|nr:uracil-DNA glycosylase [bacterium AH-315-E10]